MEFCVGLKSLFENHGYDTSEMRHSRDGVYVLCHKELAEKALPDLKEVMVFEASDPSFLNMLNGEMWTD